MIDQSNGSTAPVALLASFMAAAFVASPAVAQDQSEMNFQERAQADGYLQAHRDVTGPMNRLGGPLTVSITQDGGGVFVSLPDNRELDPAVFGSPEMPRLSGGTPVITGVPPAIRGEADGEYTELEVMSPFGDAFVTMSGASLQTEMVDETAADAAETSDSVTFSASWEDDAGNTYAVRCCDMLATHGVEYPTFGGVVTNHLLHGWTGIGTPLMPTEFAFAAFWGMGQVEKNGEVVGKPRLIHGMLTEYVRAEGHELGFDEDVNPKGWHFHLMVPPMMPDPEAGAFTEAPLDTGFELPNGETLPFWHVMFESIDVDASAG